MVRPPAAAQAGHDPHPQQPVSDFTQLPDPEFIEARRRVREKLETLPGSHPGRARLSSLYDALTDEFDRRARTAWQQQ